ncbi:hypothetical protein EB796_005072 [Bugula neritina]|uniref:Uncharacterized protein n=1 Tax=Bugula neritina TaxID=10212 RepID=A0A7J7KEG9_BUGNE|nr:hypothetical protein EB796_005072 [Bugula neritina]
MAAFSAKSDRVKTVRDVDANALFENHSVAEVRDIEKKIRHDIEWKKEEMRDLISSASLSSPVYVSTCPSQSLISCQL